MNNYTMTFKAWDEEGNSSYKTMTIQASDVDDASSKFYDLWQDEDVVLLIIDKVK